MDAPQCGAALAADASGSSPRQTGQIMRPDKLVIKHPATNHAHLGKGLRTYGYSPDITVKSVKHCL